MHTIDIFCYIIFYLNYIYLRKQTCVCLCVYVCIVFWSWKPFLVAIVNLLHFLLNSVLGYVCCIFYWGFGFFTIVVIFVCVSTFLLFVVFGFVYLTCKQREHNVFPLVIMFKWNFIIITWNSVKHLYLVALVARLKGIVIIHFPLHLCRLL